jgi:hypothetical protein
MRLRSRSLSLFVFLYICTQLVWAGYCSTGLDVYALPQQANEDLILPLERKVGNLEYTISALAKYDITALVVSKYNYWYDDWRAKVAPYDVALVWGDLAKPENEKYVTYSQFGRWYYYRWRGDSPYDENFIIRHSSNNHIIPANDIIKRAIASLRKRRAVRLEGYLVNVDGKEHGRPFWWHSSLTRDDTGDGSCELFYVNKVTTDGKTYQ